MRSIVARTMSGTWTYVVVVISPATHGEAGRDERFTGDARVGIVGEDGVEDGIRDRVRDLVGMAFGD